MHITLANLINWSASVRQERQWIGVKVLDSRCTSMYNRFLLQHLPCFYVIASCLNKWLVQTTRACHYVLIIALTNIKCHTSQYFFPISDN